MIDAALLGAVAGLALGLADFWVLGRVLAAMARERPSERLGARVTLNVARYAQLLFFPVAGWFAGPLLASNMGG
ncbi:hypothetical protein [Aurantimonas sp. Leaf443]|uniref:hypothetical protein n=1 Tax=Aurantimonas sp. Leaf443 TaxID=1736378 RepID=UPI0006FE3AEA|nr:hypothetical protein [Aurantimonas sp. Leaf443]KQT82748.1 hypothetical protein ASG48_14720 [Aurantimonas sp. Leaf443]